jgi:hypothetical protein
MIMCLSHALYLIPPSGDSMGFIDNVSGGFAVAFGVTAVIAIANGLSTYIFDGQTLSSKVQGRIGGGSS